MSRDSKTLLNTHTDPRGRFMDLEMSRVTRDRDGNERTRTFRIPGNEVDAFIRELIGFFETDWKDGYYDFLHERDTRREAQRFARHNKGPVGTHKYTKGQSKKK